MGKKASKPSLPKKQLEPFSAVIQVCPDCGKFDAYLGDDHDCNPDLQAIIRQRQDDLWD